MTNWTKLLSTFFTGTRAGTRAGTGTGTGEVAMRDFRPKAMDDVDRIDEGDPYIYHRKCCDCNREGTLED